MRLATERIRELARDKNLTLSELLQRAGVSRTAYYSLARKSSVVPRSLDALASALDMPVSGLLEELPPRVVAAQRICAEHPDASFENVWHVLTLLEANPIERLNRSLTRGRTTTAHR